MNTKILLTFSALLLLQFSANSQAEAGLLTGINYSTHYFKSDLNIYAIRPRIDYFGGLAYQYSFNNKWRLSSNAIYSREGFKNELEGIIESLHYRFSYLSMLSEAEYRLFPFLSFGAGANLSLLTDSDTNYKESGWKDVDRAGYIKKINYSLTGKIKLEYRGFYTFARYNLGIRDIENISHTDATGNVIPVDQFTRNMQFGLGYMVKLSK